MLNYTRVEILTLLLRHGSDNHRTEITTPLACNHEDSFDHS